MKTQLEIRYSVVDFVTCGLYNTASILFVFRSQLNSGLFLKYSFLKLPLSKIRIMGLKFIYYF